MNKLTNKVAVITGGSSGIGLEVGKLFAAAGAHVVLFARGEDALSAAQRSIGHAVHVVQGDVGDSTAQARLFEEVRRLYGRVDVLFANAAVVELAPIEQTPEEAFDRIVTTNTKGAYLTLQHAIPLLSAGASVILTTSWLNRMGFPGSSVVAMTKASVRALVRVAAAELGPRKVRVNAVSPGAIETPLWGKLGLPEDALKSAGTAITSQIPIGRWGKPEEIAQAVLFLASDASSYVNGQELQVDGGLRQV